MDWTVKWPPLATVSISSGHCTFCRWKIKTKRRESSRWDVSGSHTVDLWIHISDIYLLNDIISQQPIWFKSVRTFLLPPSKTRRQKRYFCHQLNPSSLFFSHNGLLPSPRPLQLLALPSFSSSGFLRQGQAAADRTAQAKGQLRKCGGDSWTCYQLYYDQEPPHTHARGPAVCWLKWTLRNGENKKKF